VQVLRNLYRSSSNVYNLQKIPQARDGDGSLPRHCADLVAPVPLLWADFETLGVEFKGNKRCQNIYFVAIIARLIFHILAVCQNSLRENILDAQNAIKKESEISLSMTLEGR